MGASRKVNASFLASVSLLVAAAYSDTSQSALSLQSFRGVRYCEVIAVMNDGELRANVYGTQGLSECPLSSWEALDPEAIRDELGALAIVMNGPRFWLIDSLVSFSEIREIRFFGVMRRIVRFVT